MKLSRIRLRNVRHFELWERRIEPYGGVYPPLVVTGKPGSGKTTILEAIVAGKDAASPRGRTPNPSARRGEGRGEIELEWQIEPADVATEPDDPPAVGAWTAVWRPLDRMREGTTAGSAADLLGRYGKSPSRWKTEYFHAGRWADFEGTAA